MKGKTKRILVVVVTWRHRTNGLLRALVVASLVFPRPFFSPDHFYLWWSLEVCYFTEYYFPSNFSYIARCLSTKNLSDMADSSIETYFHHWLYFLIAPRRKACVKGYLLRQKLCSHSGKIHRKRCIIGPNAPAFFQRKQNFINFRWHAHCFPSIFIEESLPSYVTNKQTAGIPSVNT